MASKVEYEDESRTTMDTPSTEDNAPKAIPIDESPPRGVKREHEVDDIETPIKIPKTEADDKDKTPSKATKAAITVSLDELRDGSVSLSTLEDAFGPSSLGILIVKDLIPRYNSLRVSLLQYASHLAHLPKKELDALTSPETHYNVGWSHGKEKLKSGAPDIHKGSFYIGCRPPFNPRHIQNASKGLSEEDADQTHDYTARSLWPPEELLPKFRAVFEELFDMIIEIADIIASAIDKFAQQHVEGYRAGFLEGVVTGSNTHKARLLHYFPCDPSSAGESAGDVKSNNTLNEDDDCALYVDESQRSLSPSVPLPPHSASTGTNFPEASDLKAGLYIVSRSSTVVKVDIPPDCLAFQTGEALELITKGKFKAVPHYVRAPRNAPGIARNTLALFMQPNLGEIVDEAKGLTFAEFVKKVAERNTQKESD